MNFKNAFDESFFNHLRSMITTFQIADKRAGGCMVEVSARGSEGRRFDTRVHQLSD